MVFVYVLKLFDNKWYIGKTNNPIERFNSHFNDEGSEWTKKYPIDNFHELIPDCDDFEEQKITLKYMEKYGIDNVRGGPFCQVIFSQEIRQLIQSMINSQNEKCLICGESGHYARNCPLKNAINNNNNNNNNSSSYINASTSASNSNPYLIPTIGYVTSSSTPITTITSTPTTSTITTTIIQQQQQSPATTPNSTTRKKRADSTNNSEETAPKKSRKKSTGNSQEDGKEGEVLTCFRCGRSNHLVTACYAKTHVKGYPLGA